MPGMNFTPRRTFLLVTLALTALLSACVPTDRSAVTPDVQVFDADLLGEWKTGSAPSDRLTFTKAIDAKSYDVATYDDDGKRKAERYVLRLMKLGDQHFYELELRPEPDAKARFSVGKLTLEKDRIVGWTFERDEQAFEQPDAKTAEVEYGGEKQKVLSMEPTKVQAYLKAHAKEMTRESLRVERAKEAK